MRRFFWHGNLIYKILIGNGDKNMCMKCKKCAALALIMLVLWMLGFASCAGNREIEGVMSESSMVQSADVETDSAQNPAEQKTSEQATDKEQTADKAPASDRAVMIPYAGEEFQLSVFAAGGSVLYVNGIKADGSNFLGCMDKEGDVFRECEIPFESAKPDGSIMKAMRMRVDDQNRCHILWMSVKPMIDQYGTSYVLDFAKCCITVMDSEGRQQKMLDLSECLYSEEERVLKGCPYCFSVDVEGNYYMESSSHESWASIVKVSADGSTVQVIDCAGCSMIEGIGVGKNGSIYCTCVDQEGNRYLGRLEADASGTEQFVSCGVTLPDVRAWFSCVAAGTDTDILLYNKLGGIYAYSDGDSEVEHRVAEEDMPVPGSNAAEGGFLRDGRLCLLASEPEIRFYYVPAGR